MSQDWTVTITMHVVTPDGATKQDAHDAVQPYVNAMRVSGVAITDVQRGAPQAKHWINPEARDGN